MSHTDLSTLTDASAFFKIKSFYTLLVVCRCHGELSVLISDRH